MQPYTLRLLSTVFPRFTTSGYCQLLGLQLPVVDERLVTSSSYFQLLGLQPPVVDERLVTSSSYFQLLGLQPPVVDERLVTSSSYFQLLGLHPQVVDDSSDPQRGVFATSLILPGLLLQFESGQKVC